MSNSKFYAVALALLLVATNAQAQNWPSGADLAREALMRAQAEKERNDRIVEQQRAAEQRRRMEEQRLRWIEEAQRRANTG
ncbi:hypothetical protein [Roseibium aggregatum]|uniref:hypothetical protein n=1 Tax=Roseibium aggregatum TaxID=187304 RepID=UPI0025AC6FE6|nr:hypothetical protein [Roseibium aggregatum]WJS05499.1 hypothetical protein QUB73_27150 [Roseibium aggregatum]